MRTEEIVVYGAGGSGREVAWLAESCTTAEARREVVCFADDVPSRHGVLVDGIPVMGLGEARRRFPEARMVAAVGAPGTRQRMVERAAAHGFAFATLVHPDARHARRVRIGEGTVVCAGSIVTTGVAVGPHVQINVGCTVSHDVVLGEFATLAPGVHVAGAVHVGARVYVGIGAVIVNGSPGAPLVIGDDAVIGAAACVTRSVPPRTTVTGVPARPR